MSQVINFLRSYWREIAWIIGLIVSIVLCCVRKKPNKVYDAVTEYIRDCAPSAINQAEQTEYKGDDKLSYCTGLILNALKVKFALSEKDLYSLVGVIHHVIEDILSTPQKKVR